MIEVEKKNRAVPIYLRLSIERVLARHRRRISTLPLGEADDDENDADDQYDEEDRP